MRRLILGAALLSSFAAPALAQDYNNQGPDRVYEGRDSNRDSNGYGYDRRDDRSDRSPGAYDPSDLPPPPPGSPGYDARDVARYDAQRAQYERDHAQYRRDSREWQERYGSSDSLEPGRVLPADVQRSWIANPYRYGLPRAARGTHWIAINDDGLLIRNYDRVILRVLPLRR
jgi:Ni/Co efflux regulator RcnB